MKIGMVVDDYLPTIGGAQTHVYYLSRTLQELGHRISIYTNTLCKEIASEFEIVRNPHEITGDLRKLAGFIRNVDMIHCHYSYYLASLATFWAKLLRKPIVVSLHGQGTLDSSVGKSPVRKSFRWFSLKFADGVVATSDEMAQIARRFVQEQRIHLIPNGVDTDYFTPSSMPTPPKNKFTVLSVRRLHPKNGVQYLVEAVPYIVNRVGENIEVLIMGAKKLEPYLRNRVQELGIEDYVKFIGEIPNEQTRDYYAIADVVAFPSSAESISIACLEAMAMEKAIVASALVPYQQLLGKDARGLLVNLFDRDYSDYNAPLALPSEKIELLANAIVRLCKNAKLRKNLGESAREHVRENYDWKLIGNKVVNVYDSVR